MVMHKAHIVAATQILAHVPGLVALGSKPRREIDRDPQVLESIRSACREFNAAASYLPNQIFIGAARPKPLLCPERPWWTKPAVARTEGRFGMIFSQAEFLAALQRADCAGLVRVEPAACPFDHESPQGSLIGSLAVQRDGNAPVVDAEVLKDDAQTIARVAWGYPGDEALSPTVIFENLATKATGTLALACLLRAHNVDPETLDLVISCSEEAVGDRYQRGGGNLAKAIAEAVGAKRASGFDVKNFCAAPIPALVVASSLIEAGVAKAVCVVAGGSVPKLGMKFQGHLRHGMPILEDCLGGTATLISATGEGPVIRHDGVGWHSVGAGSSNLAITHQLVADPLRKLGLKMTDVDLYATEMHNPELTVPQGSGDVPERNYRMIAALARQLGYLDREGADRFLERRAVAGFAPTQGHIASAICLLPYALEGLNQGSIRRALLMAKGSLFLGRMSLMSDGMSVVLET